jgi:hypothetical protein
MTEDKQLREQVKAALDTPRGQLAIGVARVLAGWRRTRRVTGSGRIGEISFEYQSHVRPVTDLLVKVGRVNAASICGASAGHLLIKEVIRVTDDRVLIKLLYGKVPWYPHPAIDQTTDFDVLLNEPEPGAVAAPETWRTRRGLL